MTAKTFLSDINAALAEAERAARAYADALRFLTGPVGKAHAKRLRKNARRLREWRGMR